MSQIKAKLHPDAKPDEVFAFFKRVYDNTPEGAHFTVEMGPFLLRLRNDPENGKPEAVVAKQRGWSERCHGKTVEAAVEALEKKCFNDSHPPETPE